MVQIGLAISSGTTFTREAYFGQVVLVGCFSWDLLRRPSPTGYQKIPVSILVIYVSVGIELIIHTVGI